MTDLIHGQDPEPMSMEVCRVTSIPNVTLIHQDNLNNFIKFYSVHVDALTEIFAAVFGNSIIVADHVLLE